jgi:hypothetical protein
MDSLNIRVLTDQNGEVVFREGKAPDVFQYRGFAYKTNTTKSFIDLVTAKGNMEELSCVVFCHDMGFYAILDDTVEDRPRDRVQYDFKYSIQAEEWMPVLKGGMTCSIKEFSDFLKRRRPDEIKDIDVLLYAVQNFRYVTNIEGDFSEEDRNNYTFNIRIRETESTVRIPKTLSVRMEIFNGSGFYQDVECEIETRRPKDPSEKPGFLVSCPKFNRYLEAAKELELRKVEDELTECLVVQGSVMPA